MRVIRRFGEALLVAALVAGSLVGTQHDRSALAAGCSIDPSGAPELAGINYHSGTSAGGTSVVITGCRFTGVTSVQFDTVPATFVFISDTEVDAISPPHPAGLVMVSLTTPSGTTPTVGNGREDFLYIDYPAGHRCTKAYISPANPVRPAGSTVTFYANSAGCPNPRYAFWMRYPNGSWYLKKAFGTDPTFGWSSSGLRPGAYKVVVWVAQQGHSTAAPEVYTYTWLTLTGCTSAAVSPSSGSAASGTPVAFTATSAGCPNPLYEFWLRDPRGVWHLGRTWGSGDWTWDTTGWAPGSYKFSVWANQQGSYMGKQQAYAVANYTLV